jgi:hypothetical protein
MTPSDPWPRPDALDAVKPPRPSHSGHAHPRGPYGSRAHAPLARVYYTVRFSHFILRDGEAKLLFDSRKPPGERPPAAWLECLPQRSVENVGDAEIHLVSVELKK